MTRERRHHAFRPDSRGHYWPPNWWTRHRAIRNLRRLSRVEDHADPLAVDGHAYRRRTHRRRP